jgi:hypothetical protein
MSSRSSRRTAGGLLQGQGGWGVRPSGLRNLLNAAVPALLCLHDLTNRGAGTDAEVFVTIAGDNGSADEIRLFTGPENFARNAEDKFVFRCKDVGNTKSFSFR